MTLCSDVTLVSNVLGSLLLLQCTVRLCSKHVVDESDCDTQMNVIAQ